MPNYEYVVVLPDGSEGEVFTHLQGFDEEPLTTHPTDGRPVRRIFSVPGAKTSTGRAKPDMSSKNLEKLGFTQYKKGAGGKYNKTAGDGPGSIQRDS